MAVVLFHAFPTLLPGGFVGVDVFFVISGFLITGILLRDHAAGCYTLSGFYARRIRRIFPALFTVLLFCFAVGWVALTADELKQLGKYIAGGASFLNNFLFWRDSGYFDNAANTKPLLHLWSLAIEEQFYLFWPLILSGMLRRRHMVGLGVLLMLLASLAYSAWKVRVDAVGAFYSPLTRSWELLLGAGLACVLQQRVQWAASQRFWLGPLGLVLVVLGMWLIHRGDPFPGWWALLPAGGAALVLLSGNDSTWLQRLLANRPIVALGLISYPLYLWHWPLLSLARIFEGQTASAGVRVGLIVASMVLAWLTYVGIERPIRFGPPSRRAIWALCIGMLVLFVGGYAVNRSDGMRYRHANRLNADPSTMVLGADRGKFQKSCGIPTEQRAGLQWCLHDNKQVHANMALLGDSKGEALLYGLSRESRPEESWVMLGPVNLLWDQSSGVNHLALDRLERDPHIEVVVLGNALRGFTVLDPDSGMIAAPQSDSTIQGWVRAYTIGIARLERARKRVVFVLDNPTLPDPNSCIAGTFTPFAWLNVLIYRNVNPHCTVRYSDHLRGTAAYQSFVQQLRAANPHLLVFDPLPLLCDIPNDRCTYSEGRKFLYSYGDHVSDHASSKIAKALLPRIRER